MEATLIRSTAERMGASEFRWRGGMRDFGSIGETGFVMTPSERKKCGESKVLKRVEYSVARHGSRADRLLCKVISVSSRTLKVLAVIACLSRPWSRCVFDDPVLPKCGICDPGQRFLMCLCSRSCVQH